jgi:hypothetical protein
MAMAGLTYLIVSTLMAAMDNSLLNDGEMPLGWFKWRDFDDPFTD